MKNMQRFRVNAKKAKTAHVYLEEILLTLFKEVTAAGVNVDGKVPHEKGRDVALSLGVDNFQASSGSVHRLKVRQRLVYKSVSYKGTKDG